MSIGIIGTGSAVPEKVLTNHDLEKMVDTSDEWIRSRSGISERHVVAEGEATSDLVARAGAAAIEQAGLTPEDIDLIVIGTFSPDTLIPSTACWVMEKLNIPNCPAFDVNAACTGWITAVLTAKGLMEQGLGTRALVVGGDAITRFVNFKDRTTCVLFGDAAGAVVLGEVDGGRGIQSGHLGADGRMGRNIIIPGGGSAQPPSQEVIDNDLQFVRMEGNEVFKFAVRIMYQAMETACANAGVEMKDLDWLIPHQANIRIIESAIKRSGLSKERFVLNLDRFGNTSAASIPLALDEAVRDGRVQKGHLVGMVAFGGGLTWGATVCRM